MGKETHKVHFREEDLETQRGYILFQGHTAGGMASSSPHLFTVIAVLPHCQFD